MEGERVAADRQPLRVSMEGIERLTLAKSAMTSDMRSFKRMWSGLWSNPSLGMMTKSAVMISRTCSMDITMALSRTSSLPVSLVSRFGSRSRMSRMGMPSLNFCSTQDRCHTDPILTKSQPLISNAIPSLVFHAGIDI